MLLFKKTVVLIFLLYACLSPVAAQSPSLFSEEYDSQLEEYLNGQSDLQLIANRLENIASGMSDKTDFENIYLRSKILLLRGIIFAKLDNRKGSIDSLELSRDTAEQALQLQDTSDCWRIMGEAGSAIMLQKGISYIIANGGLVEEYIDRAIELDAGNIRAKVLKAQSLINKPFIFGGSVRNGIKLLEELRSRNNVVKNDRFFILYNLSIGYRKQNKEDNALKTCREALTLYPGNSDAVELLRELGN